MLLTRTDFREGVFARDEHKCVLCQAPAADAHHILERRLFPDGGYYLDNGASVCGPCHLLCEETKVSVEDLRIAAKITRTVLPPHLYDDQPYSKWGDPILPDGRRMRGELFFDPSVQKALAGSLHLYTHLVKFPRTYHLPWSPGRTKDDRGLESLDGFDGEEVVVTVKMDGENTTMYSDHIHARSLDSRTHPSRNWVKALHGRIAHDIPEGWRLTGENLLGEHSIHYHNLPSYFLLFGVWNEHNRALAWDEVVTWAALLDLKTVPILYRGPFDAKKIQGLLQATYDGDECEGYVVRVTREFGYGDYRRVVGKYVRASHVHTHAHWMRRFVPNDLRTEP